MIQRARRRVITATVAAALAVTLLGLWTTRSRPTSPLLIQIERNEDWDHTTFDLTASNRALSAVALEGDIQLEYLDAQGVVVSGDPAAGGRPLQLLPMKIESVVVDHRDKIQRLRVRLHYCYDAGPLRKAAGRVVGTLGLSRPVYRWFWSHGLVDAKVHREFEGDWQVPPDRIHRNPVTLVCAHTADRAMK